MKKAIVYVVLSLLALGLLAGCNTGAASEAPDAGSEAMAGAYTEDRAVTEEDLAIFNAALSDEQRASYEPQKVATQVVAGTNYRFYCADSSDAAASGSGFVYVYIFQPLEEGAAPTFTEVTAV